MRIRSLSAVLVCLLGAAAWSQPNEKRFTLRGRAVDAQTGQPLSNLRITLDDRNWNRAAEPIMTGPDGRFVFRSLEDHQYALGTVFHGETLYHQEAPDTRWLLTVVPNDEGPEIEFRVASHPSVSGIVRDEFGDPLFGVEVALFRPVWLNGQITYTQEKAASTTDDRGWYRIRDIWPGFYFLCASFGVGRKLSPVTGDVDFLSRQSRVYGRTCHPGPPPTMFQLAPAQNAVADLVLSSVSGLTLRGHASNAPHGFPAAQASLMRDEPGGSQQAHQVYTSDGSFAFDGVEPGRYLLTVKTLSNPNGTMPLAATQTVEVKDTDIDGIGLTLEPMGAIELAVHRADATPAGSNDVRVGLRPVGQTESFMAMTDSSGSRRFPQLNPGAYWVTTRTTAPYCVQSIRFGGADEEVLKRTLTVTPGMNARLDVTLTTECSTIVGHVVAGNKPLAAARVIFLISGTTGSPGDVFEETTDVNGEFTLSSLPPGRYQIWAWSEGRGFIGPPSLADVADKASVVVVGRGQKGAVVVQSLNPEGEAK